MVEIIQRLHPARRIALFCSLGLIVGIFVFGIIWLSLPKYNPLFTGIDQATAAAAISKLEEDEIPFRISESNGGSTISVPEGDVEQLRVTLTSDLGLPETRGLELFDNADYSMTDFSQDVTYKRAIQGELARTIASVPGVKSARVHITFAPKKLFSSEQQQAKASVFLELAHESSLASEQVFGIQKMVANSIERLAVSNVSIFGHNGVELSVNENENLNFQLDKKYQIKYQMERDLTEKAYRLITLAIPPEKIAISVDVSLNFDQRKKMKQGFAANAAGEGAIVKQREMSVTSDDVKSNTLKDERAITKEKETEFVHGQETEETIFSSGEVAKIAVGVVISEDLNTAQVGKIRGVLKAGLGIDSFRGDVLAVEVIDVFPIAETEINQEVIESSPVSPPIVEELATLEAPISKVDNLVMSPWWLMSLLILPAAWIAAYRRRLAIKERDTLLIELSEWLEKDETQYASA